jgi:hypothetical protein
MLQDLIRIDTASQGSQPPVPTIGGTVNSTCDYSQSTCGDGGPSQGAQFTFTSRNAQIPIVGLVTDGRGSLSPIRGLSSRGSSAISTYSQQKVEVAGVSRCHRQDRYASQESALAPPYDGALATSASLNQPVGVAMDNEGNLWISDSNINKIRYANLGTKTKILFPASSASEREVAAGTLITVNSGMSREQGSRLNRSSPSFTDPHGLDATAQGIFIADSRGGKMTSGAATPQDRSDCDS